MRGRFSALTRPRVVILFAVIGICILSSPEARSAPQRKVNPQSSSSSLIRTGTRLVEVEVVVRDKNGPVTGLTRDDFTLSDQGKSQQIAVFNGGAPAPGQTAAISVSSLPPGAVSNRVRPPGQRAGGATVLLLDQLNTSIDNQGYSRGQLLKYLDSAGDGEQIAIYLLGKNLSVVQDLPTIPRPSEKRCGSSIPRLFMWPSGTRRIWTRSTGKCTEITRCIERSATELQRRPSPRSRNICRVCRAARVWYGCPTPQVTREGNSCAPRTFIFIPYWFAAWAVRACSGG